MLERLKPEEIEYIRDNCLTTSDQRMADYLNRDVRTIMRARRKLGIEKKVGGGLVRVDLAKSNITDDQVVQASEALTEDQRKSFYKTQFTNSLYYKNLKEQFTKEEIDYYLEEWGSLCLQFEDIVATEKRQIDEYIKMSIYANRISRNIYVVEEEIKKIQQEIEVFRAVHKNLATDPEAQERDQQLGNLLLHMNGQCKSMTMDYQRNLEMRTKLLGELNARRKDRVDQLSKRGTTILSVLQEFRDKDIRKNQGRHMELVRMAMEKKKKEWRKPTTYPDGTKDCILLDENSELPEKEIVLIQSEVCKAVEEFGQKKDAKILVVDDDHRRNQFFGDVFKDNKLDFASNADKAIEKIKNGEYDLICLDYDLGMDTKGTRIAEEIISSNICQNSKILVHSMNRKGAYEIRNYLFHSRDTEVYPFEDIVKKFGEKNAQNSIGSGTNQSNKANDSEG